MFMGQYDYAVDAKGRLNFPAKFRDGMGETFIVTRWLDHCLAAFPPEEFEKVAQRIAEKGMVKGRNVSRRCRCMTGARPRTRRPRRGSGVVVSARGARRGGRRRAP